MRHSVSHPLIHGSALYLEYGTLYLEHGTLYLKHYMLQAFQDHVGFLLACPDISNLDAIFENHLLQQLGPQVNEFPVFCAVWLSQNHTDSHIVRF